MFFLILQRVELEKRRCCLHLQENRPQLVRRRVPRKSWHLSSQVGYSIYYANIRPYGRCSRRVVILNGIFNLYALLHVKYVKQIRGRVSAIVDRCISRNSHSRRLRRRTIQLSRKNGHWTQFSGEDFQSRKYLTLVRSIYFHYLFLSLSWHHLVNRSATNCNCFDESTTIGSKRKLAHVVASFQRTTWQSSLNRVKFAWQSEAFRRLSSRWNFSVPPPRLFLRRSYPEYRRMLTDERY